MKIQKPHFDKFAKDFNYNIKVYKGRDRFSLRNKKYRNKFRFKTGGNINRNESEKGKKRKV